MTTHTQADIIKDLSTLLKIQNKALNVLVNKECLCIGSAIHDAILENQEAVILDIGIGTLSVDLKEMQCKFLPSKDLKTVIKKSIESKVDPLEQEIEATLIKKLQDICQEAF